MRVTKYQAHNVLRLSDIDLTLEGHHLFIVGGKNGQGKSSALNALLMALCGRSGMDWPEIALKEGEDEGWVKVEIAPHDEDEAMKANHGTLTIELRLKRKRGGSVVEEFRVVDGNGEVVPQPRSLLARLCALRAFDPLAFERMGKKEQQATLERLLNLDFAAERKEYDRLYKERQNVNRDAKTARTRYEGLPGYRGLPEQEVSIADLLAEEDRRRGINEVNAAVRDDLADLRHKEHLQKDSIADMLAEIEELKNRLADERLRLDAIQKDIQNATDTVSQLQDANVEDIRAKITGAEETNAKVRANAAKAEAYREVHRLEKAAEEFDGKIARIQAGIDKAIREAPWPVPGLSIDSEGVIYHGLPLSQAEQSMRTLISVKIGMALNPRLRLLASQDGGALDRDSLAALDSILKEGDYQMLLELATRGTQDEELCAVVVEDGAVKGATHE